MTDNPVLKIIEKAFGDDSLRGRLMSDMQGTLEKLGEKLSPEQVRELARALDESGEAFASGLDQRLSQSGVSLNPQALLQQGKKKAGQKKDVLELSPLRQSYMAPEAKKNHAGRDPGGSGGQEPPADPGSVCDQDEPDYEAERD